MSRRIASMLIMIASILVFSQVIPIAFGSGSHSGDASQTPLANPLGRFIDSESFRAIDGVVLAAKAPYDVAPYDAYGTSAFATGVLPDRYIVILKGAAGASAAANDMTARYGIRSEWVYFHALSGFSATIPAESLNGVRSDPRVAYVVEDRLVQAVAQTLPTGVDRIEADRNSTARIDGVESASTDARSATPIRSSVSDLALSITASGSAS